MTNAVADPRQPYWHPSWIEPDPHYRAIRREHTKRALRLARDLGAPHITTEPGGPLAEGQSWQAGAAVFYEELMPCIEVAEQLGVPLLIEPEPGLLIERFDQYMEFVGPIDSPMIGLNFDIGHAYCVSEDPQDWVAKMRSHTRHYHFETSRRRAFISTWCLAAALLTSPPHSPPSVKRATTVGSPSNSTRTSTIPTRPPVKQNSTSKPNCARCNEREANGLYWSSAPSVSSC